MRVKRRARSSRSEKLTKTKRVVAAASLFEVKHAVGFEPTLTGFAIQRLDPLGYACVNSIEAGGGT